METHYLSRHTGWQLVYGLRLDQYANGDHFQSELGCLDAPTAMAAGSVSEVKSYPAGRLRFVYGTAFFRDWAAGHVPPLAANS